jgi:hypothetical protein
MNALMLLAFVALSHGDAVGAMTFDAADGAQTMGAHHRLRTPPPGRGTRESLPSTQAIRIDLTCAVIDGW